MCGERVDAAGDESEEDVLNRCPVHACVDCDAERVLGLGHESCFVTYAMLEICSTLRVQPAQCVKDGCGDEVVPRGHAEVAVEEEENYKDHGHEEVRGLEEFVVSISILQDIVSDGLDSGWGKGTKR